MLHHHRSDLHLCYDPHVYADACHSRRKVVVSFCLRIYVIYAQNELPRIGDQPRTRNVIQVCECALKISVALVLNDSLVGSLAVLGVELINNIETLDNLTTTMKRNRKKIVSQTVPRGVKLESRYELSTRLKKS